MQWRNLAFWSSGVTPNPEALRDAEEMIRRGLAAGFDSHESLIEYAADMLSESHEGGDFKGVATAALARVLEERKQEMRSWPAVTDCDRLDAAFEELNAMGIMARHNWTCCGTCAAAEMPLEMDRLHGQWEGVPFVGNVYYHAQDSEGAADGEHLWLGYGSMKECDSDEEYQANSVKIAEMAVQVLESHGLKVSWDGHISKRLCVELKWQRRTRPARFCGGDEDAASPFN